MSRLTALICACTVGLWTAPAAMAQSDPIQPGDYHESSVGGCTLNFAYDGGGGVYMGTAAHCVSEVGEDVALEDGTIFGDVALIGDEGSTETDWAFIRVRQEFVSRVSPAMKGNPTYPRNGYTRSGETGVGDTLQFSGYGVGFSLTAPTRERRIGLLTYDDPQIYTTLATMIFGDSGGPVAHIPSGKALGIISRLCIGLCEEEGPTVEGILEQAAAKGLSLTVRTV